MTNIMAGQLGASPTQVSCSNGSYSCHKQIMPEEPLECDAASKGAEILQQKHQFGSETMLSGGALWGQSEEQTKPSLELLPDESAKISSPVSSSVATGHLDDPLVVAGKTSLAKQLSSPPESESNILKQSGSSSKDAAGNSGKLDGRVKRTAKSSGRKRLLGTSCDRVLRSRSQEKPKAPEGGENVADVNSMERTRRKRKKKRQKRTEVDEYSRIRARLRYLLGKICYEQSLITAYSSEGWKGLSLEKIKPEKELQRAASQILRRKSDIRNLFEHIDTLCAEGRFSESLFDSDGLIDSEDIYCAKCLSKDLASDNDIILCDGACDRGFHQFCLVPPLLSKDIPPGDEGWLCPGCDCKLDCIDLLNKSQGTNVSLSDSWMKVFPEAAADGQNPDQNQGLSSDDSDDNDFDPERPEMEEGSQGDKSSSDDSDSDSGFTSEELEAPPGNKKQEGMSSDDSEDDDFNPDAPDDDENVKEESSSSDFTSDSDDLPFSDNDKSSGKIKRSKAKTEGDSIKNSCDNGEETTDLDMPSCISARRNVERLDYKKLYDETYGNASSDTSDDEDYSDPDEPKNKRKDSENTSKRRSQRSKSENTSGGPSEANEGSIQQSSCGKGGRPSVHKKIGEAAKQRLYQSFKENQYPNRPTKESLAQELGLTFQQVDKWFGNARWAFNHPSPMAPRTVRKISGKFSSVPLLSNEPPEPKNVTVDQGVTVGAQTEEPPKVSGAPVEEPPKAGVAPVEEPPKAGGLSVEEPPKTSGPPVEEPPKASGSPLEEPPKVGDFPAVAGVCPVESSVVDAKDSESGSKETATPQPKTTGRPRKRKNSLDNQPSTEKLPANPPDGKLQEAQGSRRATRRKSKA